MSLCSTACASKNLYNYSLSISSGLHPRFVLCYTNFIIINCYTNFMKSHTQRLQMTLHLIIFASKERHSEIKLSIMQQNHPLCLKCPLELTSEKRHSIFPFISKMLVKWVKLLLDAHVSQGSKEGTGFESKELFVNFTNQVTGQVIISFWG